MGTPFKWLGLLIKLISHMEKGDHRRVRDYMLEIAIKFPDPSKVPINRQILGECMDFLRDHGYQKTIDPVRGVVFTSPSGHSYGSFEAVADENFWKEFES